MTSQPVPTGNGDPQDAVRHVLAILDLEAAPDDENLFRGASVPHPNGRVFGGQVLAQSLLAAGRTVADGRLPHSLHGYFLRAGDVRQDIDFTVERLRDGRSFTARRTHALQGGAPILSMIASFQESQPGFEYADPMPAAPDPESLASAGDTLREVNHPLAEFWATETPFDVRHVEQPIYLRPDASGAGDQLVWMRARGPVPDDQLLHRALLAYACDQVMLEPVLRQAGKSWFDVGGAVPMASLDHAMWFHRDARADEWLLYVQESPGAQGGRGLGLARVYSREGRLVASIAQEGMVRLGG